MSNGSEIAVEELSPEAAQAELEADRAAHAEAMAKMQAAMEQTQKRLAECSESIRAREERVLARQQSSNATSQSASTSQPAVRGVQATASVSARSCMRSISSGRLSPSYSLTGPSAAAPGARAGALPG